MSIVPPTIQKLPNETLYRCFSYLNAYSLASVGITCSLFREIVSKDFLWQKFITDEFEDFLKEKKLVLYNNQPLMPQIKKIFPSYLYKKLVDYLRIDVLTEEIHLIIKEGAKVDTACLDIYLGNDLPYIKTIRLLIECGAKPNKNSLNKYLLSYNDQAGFHLHAEQPVLEIIQLLIENFENGVKPDVDSLNSFLKLSSIDSITRENIIKLFIKQGVKPDVDSLNSYLGGGARNRLEMVELFIENGVIPTADSLNAYLEYRTIVISEIVHLLIERGAKPNTTSLSICLFRCHNNRPFPKLVKLLLNKGAKATNDLLNCYSKTRRPNQEIVQLLKEKITNLKPT